MVSQEFLYSVGALIENARTNAKAAIDQLENLRGLEVHSSVILSQIDSGVLRGYGNSTAPMVITLTTHIGLRLVYLYAAWSVVRSLPVVVSCYPFGWACATIITRIYKNRWMKKHAGQPA